jgi:polyphosphate kinase
LAILKKKPILAFGNLFFAPIQLSPTHQAFLIQLFLPMTHSLSESDLALLNSKKGLKALLKAKNINVEKILQTLRYEEELELLQIQMVKLQNWIYENGHRLVILFEGRDAAGKGGTILRFTQHLVPRRMRVVALPKPTDLERGQWYFQRYIPHLPNPSEIVFFDRSWYNRAVVEPAMEFCTQEQYQRFMKQVPEFEHLLIEDGVFLVKFWFNLSKKEQAKRFKDREKNPLKEWKLSPVDRQAQEKWDTFTHYREAMLKETNFSFAPWIIIDADNKQQARLEAMRYLLGLFDYSGKKKAKVSLQTNPEIIHPYQYGMKLHD